MSKTEMLYSKKHVNRAGLALISGEPQLHDEAKQVLDNWRACHIAPLNSFQVSLRNELKKIDGEALVSQRLKRTPSILTKIERNPGMKLARMQDVGGIRAVVKNMKRVREIQSAYTSGTKAFSIVSGGKDYINYPKASGYRSVHQIFKCKDGFSIELQIRTQVQHAWATAVETMGTFLDHSLKSSEGPDDWLAFFSLASSAFAILEGTPRIEEYSGLSDQETFELLLNTEKKLDVDSKLSGFRVAARRIKNDKKSGKYHLVTLDLDKMTADIKSYQAKDIEHANAEYSKVEEQVHEGRNIQVVLVTSESIAALKKAYPSYFLDSQNFSKQLGFVEKELEKRKTKKSI